MYFSSKICPTWRRNARNEGKIQKFLSQPFNVAETFTGLKGKYVPLKDTIEGFKAIIDGDMDKYPESAFLMAGTIDDVLAKARQIKDGE